MKKYIILFVFILTALALSAQTSAPDTLRIAQGAQTQLAALLEKPAMAKAAAADPLGRNWFRLENDAHVFTEQVSVRQVAAALLDLENYGRFFDGDKSKLSASNINRSAQETIVDFISTAIIPVIRIQLKTPYRSANRVITNTNTIFSIEMRQIPQDSETNRDIKNMYASRYVEEVSIGGRRYTYIRTYSIADVNASILPGAKNALERNSAPANEEALFMLINAAKTK
ncbi:MAG: hypothetical protein FWC03_10485 [Treponema sp.]|nr:hypothetical protein [Treponema sp.]